MARTIDNLGLDISNRYAEDRELFDESFIKDARSVTSQTSVTTTTPSTCPSSTSSLTSASGKRAGPPSLPRPSTAPPAAASSPSK